MKFKKEIVHGWANLPEVFDEVEDDGGDICEIVREPVTIRLLLPDVTPVCLTMSPCLSEYHRVFFQGFLRHLSARITTYNLLNPKASSNVVSPSPTPEGTTCDTTHIDPTYPIINTQYTEP